ncbi:hypothetical protein LTR86_009251 [Recurvomyces mirabilis]|nr:hypothetical protein LTR86_009251 [Recurvomyces mirabilis]
MPPPPPPPPIIPGFHIPSFSPQTFMIYPWPFPRPRDFTKLYIHYREWKQREDVEKVKEVIKDGVDEWAELVIDPDFYGSEQDMHYSMGRVLVNRAKVAFCKGISWEKFVTDETRCTENDIPLQFMLRMAIFERLAARLCNEIWSKEFPGPTWRAAPVQERKDSKVKFILHGPRKPEEQSSSSKHSLG